MPDTYTPNLRLTMTAYNSRQWQDKVNDNFKIIDAIVGNFTSITGIVGVWQNSTVYNADDVVIDPDTGTLWKCNVPHTSAVAGTFTEERVNNLALWSPYNQAAAFRGEWQPNTSYSYNDFVVKTDLGVGRYAISLVGHTSSNDFNADLAQGKWAVLIDGNLYILPSLSGAGDENQVVMSDPTGTSYTLTSLSTLASMLGFPQSGLFSNKVTANLGIYPVVTPPAGTTFQGITDTGPNISLLDAFYTDGAPSFVGRRARGFPNLPSALLNNDPIVALEGIGRCVTGYSGVQTGIRFFANQNWSDTVRGTRGSIYSTANGGLTTSDVLAWAGAEITALALPSFTSYVPVFTSAGGTFTTITLGHAKFLKLGKLVLIMIAYTVTDVGTATGAAFITLPAGHTVVNTTALNGTNTTATFGMTIALDSVTPRFVVRKASDGSFGHATGNFITFQGFYETTA